MFPNIGSQYHIIKEVGRGGAGIVWQAVDTYTGHLVAIKYLFSSAASIPEVLEKFKIEANIYLMLSHKNIVALKDFIVTNDNKYYLIMEFIDGNAIDDYMQKVTNGAIPAEVAIALMKEILQGLDYAHNMKIPIRGYNGVLHLDIKPSNILISNKGKIKIIDYGISQGSSQDRGDKIMGSPMYMAPEQLDLSKKIDHKTDIYSAGVLLYQMITGVFPYGETKNKEELFRHINLKSVGKISNEIDTKFPLIQNIIDTATAKNPINRYQSCEEFLSDLNLISS